MDLQSLSSLFATTYNPDPNVRKAAELQIRKVGFTVLDLWTAKRRCASRTKTPCCQRTPIIFPSVIDNKKEGAHLFSISRLARKMAWSPPFYKLLPLKLSTCTCFYAFFFPSETHFITQRYPTSLCGLAQKSCWRILHDWKATEIGPSCNITRGAWSLTNQRPTSSCGVDIQEYFSPTRQCSEEDRRPRFPSAMAGSSWRNKEAPCEQ